MSEFTKGPWEAESVESGYVLRASDEHETWVARVIQGYPSKEQKANAHLISAAPDMYEALKRLIDYVEIEFEGKAITHGLDCSVINAKNMIAKAEGK